MAQCQETTETAVVTACNGKLPLSQCPSARIIKVLLKKLQFTEKSEIAESIRNIFKSHNYTVTDVLNDVHHIKYDHGIDADDSNFDEAFAFFVHTESTAKCKVKHCDHIQRHYRDRGALQNQYIVSAADDVHDGVLMDTMAMVHCYFVHSFDLNRLTKEERDRVNGAVSDDDKKEGDSDDLSQSKRIQLIHRIMTQKEERFKIGRGNGRYRDIKHDEKSETNQNVDFVAISKTVDIDAVTLTEGLKEYDNDRDRLIGDLIDVVYAENVEEMKLWSALEMEDDAKRAVFGQILFGHFDCIQLNTANLLKLSLYIITRKALEIDGDALKQEVTTNDIDGRMFDKKDSEHFENMGKFAKRFKSVSNCKAQHLRQLYIALRKWQYVEPKEPTVLKQKEEPVEDTKEEEEEKKEDTVHIEHDHPPDIYEIGKRFYFWDSHRKHPDFVAPKYENIKQEIFDSPLLSGLITMRAWNELTASIEILIRSDAALKLLSNGQSEYMYNLKKREPIDANHLRSLKLYTDYTDLSAKLCAILRKGNKEEIAQIAHWTRSLIEMVQCFGKQLSAERAQKTYFRGVDRTFIFKMIATRFHLPLSTTSNVK